MRHSGDTVRRACTGGGCGRLHLVSHATTAVAAWLLVDSSYGTWSHRHHVVISVTQQD